MKIGILSDTHNYFDPSIPKLFRGVGHILHGGDVGQPEILRQLREIAPVTAVCGNTDDPALGYPFSAEIELGGVRFLVRHIVNPHSWTSILEDEIARLKPGIVVYGHTHKAADQQVRGVRFFNPGYAGKMRFSQLRSLTVAAIHHGKVSVEHFGL
jgi:putative phosphoesterase